MATVSAWGNSLGLRLPKYVTERTAIRAGDQVYVRLLDSGEILVRVVKARDIPAVFCHWKAMGFLLRPSR